MESPGEYLKREREHRGVSLLSIQEATRVPMKYLEALEANDYDNLPHGTFTKGFIKNYCKCLGLDEVDAALRFEQFMKEKAHGAETSQKVRVKSSKKIHLPANPRAVAAAAAGVAILIIVIAYFALSKKTVRVAPAVQRAGVKVPAQPQAPVQAQVPAEQSAQDTVTVAAPAQRQAQTPVKAQPENPAPDKADVLPVQAVVKQTERKKAEVVKGEDARRKPVVAAIAPIVDGTKVDGVRRKPVVPAIATRTPDADGAKKETQAQSAERARVLEITASEPIWVKVGIDSNPPFEVFLRKGQSATWKASKVFSLTVGNAAGVSVKLDGVALVPLGPAGKEVSVKLPAGM